jgi:ATP-dependent exoDNAse (exonuclease V) beta subunit
MPHSLSPEQHQAVYFPTSLAFPAEAGKRHLVIEAGAGAGKTSVLTERVHWLLCSAPRPMRLSPAQLILVTFSKAADQELRSRVEKIIKNAVIRDDEKQRILSRLHISTIDSLFMQLASSFFPSWWEQTKNALPASTQAAWGISEQRFPPSLTLVSEAEILPQLADEIIRLLQSKTNEPDSEIKLLDFILAGAFQSSGGHSPKTGLQTRHQGLERITAAMLHENLLRESAPPLRFALEKIHPSSQSIIEQIRSIAREMFHRRLMHGRMTHNDRMLFLYHLLCLTPEQRTGSFFEHADSPALPFQCAELIVDEYQDTNELQHEILTRLLNPESGRMVVVGDPKQSIYGFRSAHVGVFQRLKADHTWKLIELTRNFRSHPDLLPFINLLSDLTFSYRNYRIPSEFYHTTFALAAQQTFVAAKALDSGRQMSAQFHAEHPSVSSEQPTHPRVLLLGASLNKDRSEESLKIKSDIPQNDFAAWALARELKKLNARWSDVVVLCESNRQVAEIHRCLTLFGIPAAATLSRPSESQMQRTVECEELGLLLAQWLHKPLDMNNFAKFLWSGWLDLTQKQTSDLLTACRDGQLDPTLVLSTVPLTEKKDQSIIDCNMWDQWVAHLNRCRTLARRHFFSAWQLLRWGFGIHIENLAMENTALALHQSLDIWSLRKNLESKENTVDSDDAWPGETLAVHLQQLRLAQGHVESTQNEVKICTIHAAKGLEWPVVVFWPLSSRERPADNFVMKNSESATYVKWLAEDKESASLVPWINNPLPPADRAFIHSDTSRGEQVVRWSADLQDKLEQDFERQRVFYTALTRAKEMLILMSPFVSGRTFNNLRDKLSKLKQGETVEWQSSQFGNIEINVLAQFADMSFELRKPHQRKAQPPAPWTGFETGALCKIDDWKELIALQDYSPAWLSLLDSEIAGAREQSDRAHQASDSRAETSQALHLAAGTDWIEEWLNSQHRKAIQTPWQMNPTHTDAAAPTDDSILTTHARVNQPSTSVPVLASAASADLPEVARAIKSIEEEADSVSASERGLRFHAYMEHADPRDSKTRGFLKRLLAAAHSREHELEIWSTADVESSEFEIKRGLKKTQRRIIDLFCIVDAHHFPKEYWNSPCLVVGPPPTVSTIETCLHEQLKVNPHLHVIIDFKTGQPSTEHIEQMSQYLKWIRQCLDSHPQHFINDQLTNTLFPDSVKPLIGIIYYSSVSAASGTHNFSSPIVSIDKNTSVSFVSLE